MRKLWIEEWLVQICGNGNVHLYRDGRIPVRVNQVESKEFKIGVEVHYTTVLSPLLFKIVLEIISHWFRTGLP